MLYVKQIGRHVWPASCLGGTSHGKALSLAIEEEGGWVP